MCCDLLRQRWKEIETDKGKKKQIKEKKRKELREREEKGDKERGRERGSVGCWNYLKVKHTCRGDSYTTITEKSFEVS